MNDPRSVSPPERSNEEQPELLVYWRPGCLSCSSLRRALRRAGLESTEINIWNDPSAAAIVRNATGGNETVPTVRLGDTVMVNPDPRTLISLATDAGVARTRPPERWWRRRRRADTPSR